MTPNESIALDVLRHPDGATINDVAERVRGDQRNAVRAVRSLVVGGLVVAIGRRMTTGRPVVYRQTERGVAEWKASLK